MKLSVEGLTVDYGESAILEDVNLAVEQGELVALLGPSGCGKSTLLKAVCGLISTSAGRVCLDGKDVTDLPPHKRGLSIIFQDLRLFPHLNAAENVAFALRMKHVPKAAALEKASKLLADVQLDGLGNKRIGELSGGQQQRVALARALATDPSILLLDEPFSALDENLRQDMRQLVAELHGEGGMTIVFVTHDQREALELSDKVAVLASGKIVQYDTPRNIYANPNCIEVARYFGDENFVDGGVANRVFNAPGVSFTVDRPEGCCTALLRPETIGLDEHGGPFVVTGAKYHGSSTQVSIECDGTHLVAELPDAAAPSVGAKVGLRINSAPLVFAS